MVPKRVILYAWCFHFGTLRREALNNPGAHGNTRKETLWFRPGFFNICERPPTLSSLVRDVQCFSEQRRFVLPSILRRAAPLLVGRRFVPPLGAAGVRFAPPAAADSASRHHTCCCHRRSPKCTDYNNVLAKELLAPVSPDFMCTLLSCWYSLKKQFVESLP